MAKKVALQVNANPTAASIAKAVHSELEAVTMQSIWCLLLVMHEYCHDTQSLACMHATMFAFLTSWKHVKATSGNLGVKADICVSCKL